MKNNKLYSFISFLLICAILCFSVCGCDEAPDSNNSSSNTIDPIKSIKSQLHYDSSYKISFDFTNFLYNGFSQEIEQISAKDASFKFLLNRRQVNHSTQEEYSERVEYYYRYERSNFICYMKKDDKPVERIKVSSQTKQSMDLDRLRIIGADTLLPSYLEAFTEKVPGEEYTFRLPLNEVMKDDNYLNTFLSMAFAFGGKEYDESLNLYIICTCKVKKDTYQPTQITYDFTQVKPYVFGDGVLSAEHALHDDFMTMSIDFNFDLAESTEIPEEFLSAAKQ
ncbi:MAG: hypothetical protein IKV36_03215 [Clostridia bacterium]|nr:hypothetical protein [Clostridia bacterium]